MSAEKDVQKKLNELLLLVKAIPDTIICDEAMDIRNVTSEILQEIYNKFSPPPQNIVEMSGQG